jgi:hypothetical protein
MLILLRYSVLIVKKLGVTGKGGEHVLFSVLFLSAARKEICIQTPFSLGSLLLTLM